MNYAIGPGSGLSHPPQVTPSTSYIPGQQPVQPWQTGGALQSPQSVPVTGLVPTLPQGKFPGPSYVNPPGPLASTAVQLGF